MLTCRLHPRRKHAFRSVSRRALTAEAVERDQFAVFADTVLVQIAPDARSGEPGILGIDPAVAVVVQLALVHQ